MELTSRWMEAWAAALVPMEEVGWRVEVVESGFLERGEGLVREEFGEKKRWR